MASRTLHRAVVVLSALVPFSARAQGAQTEPDDPEVLVVEGQQLGKLKEESAQAVLVIDTTRDQQKSIDLGEILARNQGISVQRSGGLGSDTRFSLNGLTDDQIRFFLDGIPLDLAGFGFGIANVPVNLVDRVEVYRGVVPIEFGADALGGAVNLVSSYADGNTGSASYQIGSFGTQRITSDVQVVDDSRDLFFRANGFHDSTNNDYRVDVEVPDDRGRPSSQEIERFHDGYVAWGANAELGLAERNWAERLSVRGFVSGADRDVQHNVVMTVPYGEVQSFERTAGVTLNYLQPLSDNVDIGLVAGYTWQRNRFQDLGACIYTWLGECSAAATTPGEIGSPDDRVLWDNSFYARLNAKAFLVEGHTVSLSLSPTLSDRDGEERLLDDPDLRDPLSADQRLSNVVAGAEYASEFFSRRLQNVFFVKGYVQAARVEEPIPGGNFVRRDRDTERFGLGNSLRFQVTDQLLVKGSYEFATRLPRLEEVFGNGVLIQPNLELAPEVSHNVNIGAAIRWPGSAGELTGELNTFLRDSRDLIVLLGTDQVLNFENVFGARSIGVEGSVQWVSPGGHLTLGGNGTYFDLRRSK
ncbi:MAG: TonB-dependent receptor plug domain-containing protein [Myxococcota bacterium]